MQLTSLARNPAVRRLGLLVVAVLIFVSGVLFSFLLLTFSKLEGFPQTSATTLASCFHFAQRSFALDGDSNGAQLPEQDGSNYENYRLDPQEIEREVKTHQKQRRCGIILNGIGDRAYADAHILANYILRLHPHPREGWCGVNPAQTRILPEDITVFKNVVKGDVRSPARELSYKGANLTMAEWPLPKARAGFNAAPRVWWLRIVATRHSPYLVTMALDNDAVPKNSSSLQHVFRKLSESSVFTSPAPTPYGGSNGNKSFPRPPTVIDEQEVKAWAEFPERNLGVVGWNFEHSITWKLLELFEAAFLREITGKYPIHGDQTAYREALFQVKRDAPEFRCQNKECYRGHCGNLTKEALFCHHACCPTHMRRLQREAKWNL